MGLELRSPVFYLIRDFKSTVTSEANCYFVYMTVQQETPHVPKMHEEKNILPVK